MRVLLQLKGAVVETDSPSYALTVAMMKGMEFSNTMNAGLVALAHREDNQLDVRHGEGLVRGFSRVYAQLCGVSLGLREAGRRGGFFGFVR